MPVPGVHPRAGRLGYTVAVPIVFDQEIHVHYGQFYVESRTDDFFEGLTESRGGQANGLCGAAVPGLLFLTTGLHTGRTQSHRGGARRTGARRRGVGRRGRGLFPTGDREGGSGAVGWRG